jgi:hypothetical protein
LSRNKSLGQINQHRPDAVLATGLIQGVEEFVAAPTSASPAARTTAESYVFEARGATHTLVVDEDMEAMFIVNGGQVDLSDEGDVIRIVDAAHVLASYSAGLAAQGSSLPDAVISE